MSEQKDRWNIALEYENGKSVFDKLHAAVGADKGVTLTAFDVTVLFEFDAINDAEKRYEEFTRSWATWSSRVSRSWRSRTDPGVWHRRPAPSGRRARVRCCRPRTRHNVTQDLE